MSEVSALFSWLVTEGYVENNIFDGLHLKVQRDRREARAVSDDQLRKLISQPLFLGCLGDGKKQIQQAGEFIVNDWRFWIPLLALFSGARQGELAQLEVNDIRNEDGIDYLRITDIGKDPQKSIKTSSSDRDVPLHPKLIELGFKEFVDEARKMNDTRLFPEIERDSRGSFSQVSKFYQPYFNALRTDEAEGRSVVFHSLRHRFIDELRERYTDDQIKPLVGHATSGVTGRYGINSSLSLQERNIMVRTIKYTQIDWSKVIVRKQ